MKGRILMLNFLVDYLDPAGVNWHTSFQAEAGSRYHQMAAVEICRRLKAEGCTPQLVTCILGDYTLAELELLCKNGLPQSLLPLHITCEVVNTDQPYNNEYRAGRSAQAGSVTLAPPACAYRYRR